jgi:hypothetical protein
LNLLLLLPPLCFCTVALPRSGQWRRIVQAGVNVSESPSNRTWVLDAPFTVTPDLGPDGSAVEIMPFRGRNIFYGDTYYDGKGEESR